jgi:hypothetical protein
MMMGAAFHLPVIPMSREFTDPFHFVATKSYVQNRRSGSPDDGTCSSPIAFPQF